MDMLDIDNFILSHIKYIFIAISGCASVLHNDICMTEKNILTFYTNNLKLDMNTF